MKSIKRLFVVLLIFVITIFLIMFGVIYYATSEAHKPYMELINKYSQEYNIERELLFSVIKAESGFDKEAVSRSGAVGLMQLMPDTSKWISQRFNEGYDAELIKDPDKNIKYGSYYLSYLIGRFKNVDFALMAYNAGPTNVQNWIDAEIIKGENEDRDNIPFNETKNYVKKIKNNYRLNKKVYDFYYDTDDGRLTRSRKIMGYFISGIFR